MRTYILLFLFLTACVHGPEVEHKNPLNKLNGENYVVTNDVGPNQIFAPVAKRKERLTTISGKVLMQGENTFPVPMNAVSIAMFDKQSKELINNTTQAKGDFTFRGVFPNGSYKIKVISDKYSGELDIEIKDYDIGPITVLVKKVK